MGIITNNQPRPLICGYELTEKEKRDFDYIPADEIDGYYFVRYKGQIYDFSEFLTVNSEELKEWDGIYGQSVFCGVLIKIVDNDSIIMGRYYS